MIKLCERVTALRKAKLQKKIDFIFCGNLEKCVAGMSAYRNMPNENVNFNHKTNKYNQDVSH